MSSLVMLAIMPLFSQQQNSFFSNVMAQGYDNYGDNSYSQYPTEDKKYECQTGPFEGFFVSSVEFCKHIKFDDNKRDSKVGPQGPQGPIGPAGPQGIQGERGFNGTQGLQGAPGQNATEVTVNNIRDAETNQTLQCVLNTSVDPASIDCIVPSGPTTAQLTVNKTTICNPQEFGDFCNFNPIITVTGNNPTPGSFPASEATPKVVTLDEGLYSVSESGFGLGMQPCLSRGFDGGQIIAQNTIVCTNIDDSCSEDIGAGQELSCTIENTVMALFSASQGIADSSITSQEIADSSALAKIEKLKTQWLDLYQ